MNVINIFLMEKKYLKPEDYKGQLGKFSYPDYNSTNDKELEKQYYLAFNNAFYCDYVNNFCYVPFEFGSKRSYAELRAYATGQQSLDKVKKNLIGERKKNKDGKFITKMNVSFDTYYKLPQLFDIMREKNMNQEYDVQITCIDDDSIAEKETNKAYLLWLVDENNKRFLNEIGFIPQTPINPEELGIRTKQDVELYFEVGGFTLQREMACKAAINKTKLVSDYKLLQDQTLDDLICCAITGWKTYIEESTQLPKIRKTFIDNCLIPYSTHNDFNDITRAGEVREMTIAQVAKENPNLSAADLIYLAKKFAWNNPNFETVINNLYQMQMRSSFNTSLDIDPVSKVRVLVLDSQWLSVSYKSYLNNVTPKGKFIYKQVDNDYQPDKKSIKSGDKKNTRQYIEKHYSQWIIGTDMFLSYGVCKDKIYYGNKGNKMPKLDYFFAKTGNASLVERCIAIVDDINMAIIKQRNALATIPAAPGIMMQKDLLENVFMNGIRQQPEDIMQSLVERGVLSYNAIDDNGNPLYMAGGQKPIEFLDISKIANILVIYGNHIATKVNELREVLGLQNGSDSGGTSAYQGLGQTRLAFQAANASLYPTFNAYNYIFKSAFEDIIKKWSVVSKKQDVNINYSVLGNKNLQSFKLDKNFDNYDFNIEIDIAPSVEEKQNLLNTIAQSKAIGTQTGGVQGLTSSEYLYLYKKIMAGNIDEAMYLLAKIEQSKLDAYNQQQAQNMQQNADIQQQSAQMKAQMDENNLKIKGDNEKNTALIEGLMKQNLMLMEMFLNPKKDQPNPQAPQIIPELLQSNNAQLQNIISPQPTPEQMQAMQQQEQGEGQEQGEEQEMNENEEQPEYEQMETEQEPQ